MKRFLGIVMLASSIVGACGEQEAREVGHKVVALDASAWDAAQWISVVDAPVVEGRIGSDPRSADGASWFVSTVKNDKKVVSARWMTTALGVYELYLNGRPVGQEVLKPGFTHAEKTRRSFTYDITDAFAKKPGEENVLSAQVTPGWWADKIVTPGGHDGMVGRKCAFRAVLAIIYADGTQAFFGTDTQTWKAGIAGPVKHAGIFDGETYDARELPGYDTPEKLSAPEINTEFAGEILPSEGAEVYKRRDLALKPVKAYVWKGITDAVEKTDDRQTEYGKVVVTRTYAPGEVMTVRPGETLVVDFGQNASAVPSFVFKAPEGTVLTCLPAEILNDGNGEESRGMDGPAGTVYRRNLRLNDHFYRIDYTFADNPDFVAYEPHCTFFGFSCMAVTATDEVQIRSVVSIPVTSIARKLEAGTLTTGDKSINKLISNAVWGQRSNYLSIPTDCPQRDERLGWTADTQVFTETGTFFANTDLFFRKWMRDMRDSQSETGAFPGVAPTAQYGNEMMRFGWADAGIIVPWTIWKQFGDKAMIEENWEAMDRFMKHVDETRYDEDLVGEENGHFEWADWLSYEPLEGSSGRWWLDEATHQASFSYWRFLGACYCAIDADMMADMAAATGRDAAKYRAMAESAKAYMKEKCLDAEGNFLTPILNTMQTPALFALKLGLVEGTARENLITRLKQNFADHDGCLQTGFLGTSILMQTLTENGMADIAYDLLFQRKNPSWLYTVDNGATTMWERWNSYTVEGGVGPNGMNSYNHYAYGCVCQWLWETAAGIAADPANPGFKHILLKPVPDERLGSVTARYQSAAGLIESAWRIAGGKWSWSFTIPKGATASVTLPGETEAKEYGAGKHTVELAWPIIPGSASGLTSDVIPGMTEDLQRGIDQCAALWRPEDGTKDEFNAFVKQWAATTPEARQALFEKLSRALEIFNTQANQLTIELGRPTVLAEGDPGEIDYLLNSYDASAHFSDDMFASKVAFITILNFPHYTLEEKNALGPGWDRQQWAYARLGDVFTERVPAAVSQAVTAARSAAEGYVDTYNIRMGHLLTEEGERLFPEDMSLLSHWNLRDELKSNYADVPHAHEKQEMIYQVMERIVTQEIPAAVVNNPEYDWAPASNRVWKDGKEVSLPAEGNVRYSHILNQFHTYQELDRWCPAMPTAIDRNFEGSIEMNDKEVEALFIRFITSDQVQRVGKLIAQRLGRDLRPYDIWYDGFKSRSAIPEDKLTAETQRRYPDAEAFHRDMPRMLRNLGFDAAEAQFLADHIVVEGARGSGHAWECVGRTEPARLRTRIGAGGMDYKGYNIAVHEFGHNVEQVTDLYHIDYYPLAGVPNTAITESMAFLFQVRDLQLLGYGRQEMDANATLDIFWGMYEIMGVSLVDMYTWRWLYEHPETTADQLRDAVLNVAREVWNKYYEPVLGTHDSPLLAIYSHMLDYPMYLPNYPIGHIVHYQLEEHLAKCGSDAAFATELQRIYRQGRLTPQLWMQGAVGAPISVDPILTAVSKILEQ